MFYICNVKNTKKYIYGLEATEHRVSVSGIPPVSYVAREVCCTVQVQCSFSMAAFCSLDLLTLEDGERNIHKSIMLLLL